jgi:hypothetical protein
MGLKAKSLSPPELAATLKANTERWSSVGKAIGFTADP